MRPSPQIAYRPPVPPAGPETTRVPADRVYQTVTIAAILLVIGTMWVF